MITHFEVDGRRVAYRLRSGRGPTLVFLPGYGSDMEGNKALALDAFAERTGIALLRLDYSGTGSSEGEFRQGTLARWLTEVLAAIDQQTEGPLILIGSSMGGWLALHAALQRPDRVQALVGIAAAPDFTNWGFTAEQAAHLTDEGHLTRTFWESGQQALLLDGRIDATCPVRLVHGAEDRDVPLDVAFRTMRALRSADVQLNVIKGGGHRLSEPHEIDAILRTVQALLEPAP
ncbi:alpha/beta hydrolase [Sphingomonas limnosediminicola]